MEMWHEQLGFDTYPLDPRSNPELVGVQEVESRLKNYILQGNMCLLSGPTGSGKTSMLKRLSMDADLADFKFIYISADGVKHHFDVSDAIQSHKSFWERLTFSKPKNLVILLDECQLATRTLTESIKSKWNFVYPNGEKCIQSVIVCQIEHHLGTNFSGSFADRIGRRILRMPRLDPESLKEVLRIRLAQNDRNYVESFSDEALEFLVDNADRSVRQLLEYTDAVFRAHAAFEEDNPLVCDKKYHIPKEMVFNALQMSGIQLKAPKPSKSAFKKIFNSRRYSKAIEMFEEFGTLSPVGLAEKLDTTKKNANSIIRQLKKWDAILLSHEEDDQKFYVISPRLRHELTRE
ncbi:MAG: AAA family ATPase [Nanoarchaeota archaeon]